MTNFLDKTATGYPTFYLTYSRRTFNKKGEIVARENWQETSDRAINGLVKIGELTNSDLFLIKEQMNDGIAFVSGRWLWVGGIEWVEKPENYSGGYNCTSTEIVDWESFGLLMNLGMQGSGTGAVLEDRCISQLPSICNVLSVKVIGAPGEVPKRDRFEYTIAEVRANKISVTVGDSRQGWVQSYQMLLEIASDRKFVNYDLLELEIDISHVRGMGEPLEGFGGVANPEKLPYLYERVSQILNAAVGRQLNMAECCLLIDEAAVTFLAGNIRRSAGIRQFDGDAPLLKLNLWQQDENGNWRIDPLRDALRAANHTRVFHQKPTLKQVVDAIRSQYDSGEGAIQWAGEAVRRANADLLIAPGLNEQFLQAYDRNQAEEWLKKNFPHLEEPELKHRLSRYGLNPCISGDTWIHTEYGPRKVAELIGIRHRTYVNGELFATTQEGFFCTGTQEIVKLSTYEGYSLSLTANHKLLKVTVHTNKNLYSEWTEVKDLRPNDRVLLHNHRGLKPWVGEGTFEEGRVLGRLVVDDMAFAAVGNKILVDCDIEAIQKRFGISLKSREILPEIERLSYQFYRGFLHGVCNYLCNIEEIHLLHAKGVSIKIHLEKQSNLEIIQRMLLRIGIFSSIFENELVIKDDNLYKFQQLIPLDFDKETLSHLLLKYQGYYDIEKFVVTVSSIEPVGIQPVYDCTVPGPARFDANGFIAHNCGEIIGSNFHCVSGDTLIITRDGLHQIKNIVGEPVEVWNGAKWSRVVPLVTGTNRKLYRIKFSDGSCLDCTENHKFYIEEKKGIVEYQLKDLIPRINNKEILPLEQFSIDYTDGVDVPSIWAYTLGVVLGDGWVDSKSGSVKIRLYGDKVNLNIAGTKVDNTGRGDKKFNGSTASVRNLNFTGDLILRLKNEPESLNIIASWNRKAILAFLAGLADTDGFLARNNTIRICVSNWERIKRIKLLLTKCGIRSTSVLVAKKGDATNFGVRRQDYGYIEILNHDEIPCQRLQKKPNDYKKSNHRLRIKQVEELPGVYSTYCFEEPERHKAVFGNVLTGNCNLSEIHLNQIEPRDYKAQEKAFTAGALSVSVLLNQEFAIPRYQYSRELDPIVGVSFTGLFDFFVNAFGIEWLRWWEAGRTDSWGLQSLDEGTQYYLSDYFRGEEKFYLNFWRKTAEQAVWDYCDKHQLKRPNRCTTVQPAGCLDGTALRVFDRGLLYADEMVSPGSGETVGMGLTVRGGIPVDSAIANEPLPLVKITLKNGRVIRATPNHRFSVNEQWIESQHLVPGQIIDHSLGEYSKEQDPLLLPVEKIYHTRESRLLLTSNTSRIRVFDKEITTPSTLNPELGYFLGVLFGNGFLSLSNYQIKFNHKSTEILYRLKQIGSSLFGISGNLRKNASRKYELVFASSQLFDWLIVNNLAKTDKSTHLDRIPETIRRGSRNTLLSFFAGLIDSCVAQTNSFIESTNEKFIRNLQQVGEAIGLSCSISRKMQETGDTWSIYLNAVTSKPEAVAYLNEISYKCEIYPIVVSSDEDFPYSVVSVEIDETVDYSYDFAVSGLDDDDSWYWQGALKSHNTKSLLTGASPGWHPPKAQRYIRRITFAKNDPVALACMDYGYNIVPSQSSDETGKLLDDPFDSRCKEWLVEIPVEVPWANLPGASDIDVSKFSAQSQFDFYMTVQKHYVQHNASGTIELRQEEIPAVADRIYRAIQDDEGYISVTLLARFDAKETYPRLPFEPIDKTNYERLVREVAKRRKTSDFFQALKNRDADYSANLNLPSGPAGCDSDKCLFS